MQLNEDEQDEYSDNAFGFQLKNVHPEGAKLSKKSLQIVNIVTDLEMKKKADAYAQLIAKLDQEEEKTWGSQFITACMLHPTKGDDGEIQDIQAIDAVFHFATIGWKLFFSIIPPAHYFGGIPCFFLSLAVIGVVTYVVGEFANLFGCVLGIKPGVTAITFVALGTSLPDTFASMQAAQQEKYADAAVGNVTGSNSVNVFLGLGLPWLIATFYEMGNDRGYYVPAGSLGFSVVVFIICAVLCIICLLVRRWKVGGELGGEKNGRTLSLIFLVFLWFVYIIMSVLQAYEVGGEENWKGLTFGIQGGVCCPYKPTCKSFKA
jgi:solute carrier family 8 (sodium/calcium exchanger)